MITISPGQAMLIIIENTQKQIERMKTSQDTKDSKSIKDKDIHDLEIFLEKCKKNYLSKTDEKSGFNKELVNIIHEGIGRGFLNNKEYKVSTEYRIIDEDASRRYFETHLAYETLKHHLKNLNMAQLEQYYQSMIANIPNFMIANYEEMLYGITLSDEGTEFCDAITKIKSNDYYKGFDVNDRKKMELLIKACVMSRLLSSFQDFANDPLKINIYGKGYYSQSQRGRMQKFAQDDVASKYLGLMRSYMPVPRADIAFDPTDSTSSYVRIADTNIFDEKASWIKEHFDELLHPYSSSISGLMLLQLRAISFLNDNKRLEYKTAKELGDFLRLFSSLLLYNSGGHSFHEFFAVLKLKEVKKEFNFMNDFETINLNHLLYENNKQAFNIALKDSIKYNNHILAKNKIHESITTRQFNLKKTNKVIKENKQPDLKLFQSNTPLDEVQENLRLINKDWKWQQEKEWVVIPQANGTFICHVPVYSKAQGDELLKAFNPILQDVKSSIATTVSMLTLEGHPVSTLYKKDEPRHEAYLTLIGVTPANLKELLSSKDKFSQISLPKIKTFSK